jgi:anti-anti-sigma factor
MTETQVIHTGAQATIILGEKLVASGVPVLKSDMKELIGEGVKWMVLDCSQLILMDSTGIGCLVAAHNSLSKLNGSLSLIQVSPDIYDLLCSMRLDRHIKISPLVPAQSNPGIPQE